MRILEELQHLRDQLAIREGWKGHLQKIQAEDWEEKYWCVVKALGNVQKNFSDKISSMEHAVTRARGLEEISYSQARRIMELELYFSCIHFVGDTIYFDHNKALKFKRFINNNYDEPQGLSSSRYVRNK